MSDKLSSITSGVEKAVRTTIKEAGKQVFGNEGPTNKQQEHAQKVHERAEAKGRTDEEQAKIEKLRNQLHQEMTAPPPKEPEQPRNEEEEDKVGTNETRQDLGNDPLQGQSNQVRSPLPSSSREKPKVRE